MGRASPSQPIVEILLVSSEAKGFCLFQYVHLLAGGRLAATNNRLHGDGFGINRELV